MRNNIVKKTIFEDFNQNELFIASRLYREKLSKRISKTTFIITLQRMCRANEIIKLEKDIFYIPKTNKYGIIPISDKEIIMRFVDNKKGTIVGYMLYNSLNLSTQIPKTIQVLSSEINCNNMLLRNIEIHKVSIVLDESQIASINEKINKALSVKETHPEVKITYFLPDAKKKGGEYLTLSGVIKRIDEVNHNIIMMDKTEIDIFSIIDIESDIYEILDEYEGEN